MQAWEREFIVWETCAECLGAGDLRNAHGYPILCHDCHGRGKIQRCEKSLMIGDFERREPDNDKIITLKREG